MTSPGPGSTLPAGMRLLPAFLPAAEARNYLAELQQAVDWQQDNVTLFGRSHPIPRLHQWYADEGVRYRWSGLEMRPRPWLEPLAELRDRIAAECGQTLNSVLVNLYRDGDDSMGWHADDEPELGEEPVIASLSLGATRDFQLRRKGQTRVALTVPLADGDLLLMSGRSQHLWQHALPRRRRVSQPRINLTYRYVMPVTP